MSKIPVGLVGVTGYTGMELVRLLARHPALELVRATSRAEAGKTLVELYPHLQGLGIGELTISEPEASSLAPYITTPSGRTPMWSRCALIRITPAEGSLPCR